MWIRNNTARRKRSGVILLVVLSMLTLFAVVGLAFVLYAENEANASRIWREARQNRNSTTLPFLTDTMINQILGSIIYDVDDSPSSNQNPATIQNKIYGHGLARSMYGWNSLQPLGTNQNTIPYNGVGSIPFSVTGNYSPNQSPFAVRYAGSNVYPESFGRSAASTFGSPGTYIPKNANYTYPDNNNLFLATIQPSTGRVLNPSYDRSYNTSSWNTGSITPFQTLRPHPAEHPNFPPPNFNSDGTYGDVENLPNKMVQQYDSVWIDVQLPLVTYNGVTYRPLIAPLLFDLDGRINVNVAGNVPINPGTQVSNQGWGPWEMSLKQVINPSGVTSNNLLRSSSAPTLGRYGPSTTSGMTTNPAQPYKAFEPHPGTVPNLITGGYPAQPYAYGDLDGSPMTNPGATQVIQLPAGIQTWPTFPSSYQGGQYPENLNHPLFYNPYLNRSLPTLGSQFALPYGFLSNRHFGNSNLAFLNSQFNYDQVDYDQSELVQAEGPGGVLGANYVPGTNGSNPRFLITPLSNDLDRTGLTPWQTNVSGFSYNLAANTNQPMVSSPIPFPSLTSPPGAPTGDFSPNFNSIALASGFEAIDLNRSLADYRTQGLSSLYETPNNVTVASYTMALQDRQRFAQDIYNRLVVSCLGVSPTQITAILSTQGSPQYNALRWLAQLAVNIVDFIDPDDYITVFYWNPALATELPVYGTEMVRLVINEVYTTWRNDPTDPFPMNPMTMMQTATKPYQVLVFAELYNPLSPTGGTVATLSNQGGAPLYWNGNSGYQMILTQTPDTQLQIPTNTDGHCSLTPAQYNTIPSLTNAASNFAVMPATSAAPTGTNGFWVIGPQKNLPVQMGTGAAINAFFPESAMGTYTNSMMYSVPLNTMNAPTPPTLILRRLLCPHLPFNGTPGPTYNPYVTVDFVQTLQTQMYDSRQYTQNGPNMSQIPYTQQYSYGRTQPYAASPNRYVQSIGASVGGACINTFAATNKGANTTTMTTAPDSPYLWLTHLDRMLISPIELFQVSCFPPHRLTQQFITGTGAVTRANSFQHLANWVNNMAPVAGGGASATTNAVLTDQFVLYRALGLLKVRNQTLGMSFGGRVPGRVNINTIWDQQILQAVADPQFSGPGPNQFTSTTIQTAFSNIMSWRTPNGVPSLGDKPFYGLPVPYSPAASSFGTSPYQNQIGAETSILQPGLFGPVGSTTHPYLQNELLTKVFNNLTTRSNCFGLICTVGFFEYTASTGQLGPELGYIDGSLARPKFFAVIDRTNLSIDYINDTNLRTQGPKPVHFSLDLVPSPTTNTPLVTNINPTTNGASGQPIYVRIPAQGVDSNGNLYGYYDNTYWSLTKGATMLLDIGANQEIVQVINTSYITPNLAGNDLGGGVLQLSPVKNYHSYGCNLQIYNAMQGNPGPQPNFDYRQPNYSAVVPYVNVLYNTN